MPVAARAQPLFMVLTVYAIRASAVGLQYLLEPVVAGHGGTVEVGEMGVAERGATGAVEHPMRGGAGERTANCNLRLQTSVHRLPFAIACFCHLLRFALNHAYINTPPAIATFNDSALPTMGSRAFCLTCAATSGDRPRASLPRTSATPPRHSPSPHSSPA